MICDNCKLSEATADLYCAGERYVVCEACGAALVPLLRSIGLFKATAIVLYAAMHRKPPGKA
jgi:hypothetical protein